ncbi:MAG: ABC transporter permease [Caldilineales bacterium]|nr:ABC transporter permease [Caldilineales bacterium]MCW5858468.1 ABC transporter permease [Caldilineales bacterium]
MLRRASNYLWAQPLVMLALLLIPPLLWLGVIYLGSLLMLLLQSFFRLDDYTGQIVRQLSLHTYGTLLTRSNIDIIVRTATMAAAVTVAAAILAFPLAYYTARFAPRRLRPLLYLAVMLPLWSSYLVKVYAWKLILAKEGILSWLFGRVGAGWLLNGLLSVPGIGGPSLSISPLGMFIVFVYVWLPYMVLPILAALERLPNSLIEASSDLGARPGQTFRHVTLPLAFPGVVAGSIFTFSLTLGDFIVPTVLGNSSYFIGQAVLTLQGTAGNVPLAAAMTMGPILIMAVYLLIARRFGAFEAL